MTKNELMEALSYHGWAMKGEDGAWKGDSSITVYESEALSSEVVVYGGVGLSFIVPLMSVDIKGNRLTAEWDNNKVEVWI